MTRSRIPRSVGVSLATAFLASGVVTACSSPATETYTEDVYCANEEGEIIDERYCDDDDRSFVGGFIWIGGFGRGLPLGYRLSGGQHFPYNDAAARERAGLPRTGKVTGPGGLGGTVTKTRAGTSKGGGFGGSRAGSGS